MGRTDSRAGGGNCGSQLPLLLLLLPARLDLSRSRPWLVPKVGAYQATIDGECWMFVLRGADLGCSHFSGDQVINCSEAPARRHRINATTWRRHIESILKTI